jgi:hypothetical protein
MQDFVDDRALANISSMRSVAALALGAKSAAMMVPLTATLGRGGCPIMTFAVESDDADPQLRDAARRAMTRLTGLFERIIAEGMRRGEFAKEDARARARVIVASVEGAIMLTNLYKDGTYMEAVLDQLERSVRSGFR